MKNIEPTANTIAERTLEYVNWTGIPLLELIDAGRVFGERELFGFVQASCGKAANIDELKDQREAARIIGNRFNII